jgi:SNF2 family DNA or RNA helicase
LARLADIKRVLVVCPASLKSQWRSEIARFSGRSVQLVMGTGEERAEQYGSEAFFTICNYEQILRDLTAVESVPWDLIVLDEGQRIKNWESKTSNVIQLLQSTYRLVLSGTPLENNLGELFTVARFVDEHRLGPAYQFFNRHRVVDERGRTIGYQRLDELRATIRPILLRRTRAEVAKQLPERTDEIVRIEPTAEQKEFHDGQMQTVAQITSKKYFTEMDLLRLRRALAMARMVCDSTFLIDQEQPEYSTKLERLGELLEDLIDDPTRKIVIFSEWRRMLDRIERRLDTIGCDHVRLDGQVPQKNRAEIVARFQDDPNCRVILMTNAGSTGLNLQSANTVINVDLPWNPAVLEQRIARAHRMGQQNPVHVYKLVTTDTIEESLLDTLASKQDLANASLDMESQIEAVAVSSGSEDLRRRLEKIIGPTPKAPVDESQQRRVEAETASLQQRRDSVSAASGQLVSAALSLAGELINQPGTKPPRAETVDRLTERLSECVETDSQGRPQLTISLPDKESLKGLATTLAKLLES